MLLLLLSARPGAVITAGVEGSDGGEEVDL